MKTYFPVVPKRKPSPGELNSSEACPHCKTAFVDFADIIGGLVLGCYVCGGVFLSKECREHEVKFKAEQLKEVNIVDEVVASTPFIAKCGKQCKNLAGKLLHERRCKECLKIE